MGWINAILAPFKVAQGPHATDRTRQKWVPVYSSVPCKYSWGQILVSRWVELNPLGCRSMGSIAGRPPGRLGILLQSSLVNTDLNWSFKAFAFSVAEVAIPVLVFKAATPDKFCREFLMKRQKGFVSPDSRLSPTSCKNSDLDLRILRSVVRWNFLYFVPIQFVVWLF